MIGLGPDKNKKLTKSDSIIAWVTSQEHLQTLQSGQGGRDRREARGHWITHYSLLEGGLRVNTGSKDEYWVVWSLYYTSTSSEYRVLGGER